MTLSLCSCLSEFRKVFVSSRLPIARHWKQLLGSRLFPSHKNFNYKSSFITLFENNVKTTFVLSIQQPGIQIISSLLCTGSKPFTSVSVNIILAFSLAEQVGDLCRNNTDKPESTLHISTSSASHVSNRCLHTKQQSSNRSATCQNSEI